MTEQATTTTAFERATAVRTRPGGGYDLELDPAWNTPTGPNGGVLAAAVLRAMQLELGDDQRPARSLTLHYLRPPADGAARIEVTVERSGRTLSTLSARLLQGDRVCVLALAAFSGGFPPLLDFSLEMPQVEPAERIAPYPPRPQMPPIAHRLEMRMALGAPPFSGAPQALSGGWMRLREPQLLDAPALGFFADAWLPAVFASLPGPNAVATIDLTIHFRDPAAALAADPSASVLGVFRSRHSHDGLVEEDGELWSASGVLLAQSRQLALMTERRA